MISIDELEHLKEEQATSLHPRGALALVGAWKEVPEKKLDTLVADIYKARKQDTGRSMLLKA